MPITKSAAKALRQSARRRARNVVRQVTFKKAVKEFRKLVGEKKLDQAKAKLSGVFKALDKAAKTGVIKKNKANRLKSRLAHAIAISTKTSS